MGIINLLKTFAPGIIFYIGLIIIIVLSLKGRIDKALLFLIPLFPLQNVIEKLHQFPLGDQFIDIILIFMVLGWILKAKSEGNPFFIRTSLNKLLIIMGLYTYFLLWTGSSYLNFPAPLSVGDERLQVWKNYMIFPLLYFIIVNNIKNVKQIRSLLMVMILAMFIVDYYTGNQIRWSPGLASREKIDGTFVWTGVNALAAFCAQYVFILVGLFMFLKKRYVKIILGILIVSSCYLVLFLYSRGAYAGLITGVLTIALIKKRILIIPIIVLIMFWQTLLPPAVVERINYTSSGEGRMLDSSSQKRIVVWNKSIDLYKKNPIFGIGFSVFQYLRLELGDTHNIFIKVLVEQGTIGIVLFLMLFWFALKSGWKLFKLGNNRLLKGLGLGFVACVIATITTNIFGDRWTYLQLGAYFWVFLALVVRGNIITEETNKVIVLEKNIENPISH